MATTPVNFPDTSVEMPVKQDRIDFVVVKETKTETDDKGNSTTKVTARHTSSENEIAKLEKDSPDKIAFKQTVIAYRVGSVEGLLELVPDKEEQIAIINRGLGAKFNQKIKTALTELDSEGNLTFVPVEGAFDSKELLQEGTQRRNLSPMDKAMRVLSGLGADEMAKLLELIAQQQAVQSAQ